MPAFRFPTSPWAVFTFMTLVLVPLASAIPFASTPTVVKAPLYEVYAKTLFEAWILKGI